MAAPLDPSGRPFLHEGSSFVAFGSAIENLGGTVEWDNAAKTAKATLDGRTVQVGNHNPQVLVDASLVDLTGRPFVEDGTLYVPAELFDHLGRPL